MQRFKDRIGYDQVVDAHGPDHGVVMDWGTITDVFAGLPPEWKRIEDAVYSGGASPAGDGIVCRRWTYRRGRDTTLMLEVVVSSIGPRAARERLLSAATTSSMAEIPYVRGPKGLGQLSAQGSGVFYWAFENVFLMLAVTYAPGDAQDVPIELLARDIQTRVERHQVPDVSKHAPKVERVDLSRSKVKVGETVDAAVHLRAPAEGIRITLEAPHELLRIASESPTGARFEALQPGKAALNIRVTDPNRLLVTQPKVQVEIVPASP